MGMVAVSHNVKGTTASCNTEQGNYRMGIKVEMFNINDEA